MYNKPMLKIVKDSNPNLRKKCQEVSLPLSLEDKKLLDDMLQDLKNSQDPEFLKAHPSVREGVGLAAPQVGVSKRMIVVYYPAPTAEDPNAVVCHQLVNPKIIVNSIKKVYIEAGEGCLSVDKEHNGYVYRDFKIIVDAFDAQKDAQVKITARGFDAIVLQHEIDHLDGILFYDHIDPKDPFKKIDGAVRI